MPGTAASRLPGRPSVPDPARPGIAPTAVHCRAAAGSVGAGALPGLAITAGGRAQEPSPQPLTARGCGYTFV